MIRIRPARSDEIDVLAEIGIAAWRKGIKPLVPAEVAARVESGNPFVPFLLKHGAAILVAEQEGIPIGLGACEDGGDTISDIWVSPAQEGKGAGSALVRALERQIGDRGFAEAFIEAAAGNARALGLYRNLGFVEHWRRREFDAVLGTTLEKVGLKKRV
jgi:[ribosomal protein S18]-alanine N-acetyltransferase